MEQNLEQIIRNLEKDIKKASNKEIDILFKELKKCLNTFDDDNIRKDIEDWFARLLLNKKNKCFHILKDLLENVDNFSNEEKKSFKETLKRISDIKRGFFEDVVRFLDLM